jgi:hypothetical protein
VKRWGQRALVSLAFAITAARIDPTVKYALGHGKACMRVVVGGTGQLKPTLWKRCSELKVPMTVAAYGSVFSVPRVFRRRSISDQA